MKMKNSLTRLIVSLPVFGVVMLSAMSVQAEESKATFYADLRLRYEAVDQDNALEDADALTLRSRFGVKTAVINGFSAVAELEDVTEFVDDFSVPPAGVRPAQFSVVADPDGTEIDQAYVQYSEDALTVKIGRQVLTLDGHRFVGHVGWRQDRQTFDGAVLSYKPANGFAINASYIAKRNRIFAEEADIDSRDTILNTSYQTSIGKVVAYAYLLEVDNGTNNSLDTYGVSLKGAKKNDAYKFLYSAEYASQENSAFDLDYLSLEGGLVVGGITAKLGYENLGSDGGQKGFATPLATLHKFNGWADQFLATPNAGLEDLYISLAGNIAGGKWAAVYHDFSADQSIDSDDNLGSEIDLVFSRKFADRYSAGVKFASYSAGDAGFGRVDTDKFWLWLGANFK